MHDLLHDIGLCIIAAWVLGVVAQVLRQPVILAYLVGGFVLGPTVLGWVKSEEAIHVISELGLIFLLFMIGLEIDLKKIIRSGRVIMFTGAVQIVGGCVLGVLFFCMIGKPLGGGKWDALYLGVAAALSSTVIIVKVLYDKRELDTLPGRVTLGLLVLQDLFVILFLAVQPSLDELRPIIILISFGKVGVLVATTFLMSRFVLPQLFHTIARLPELVLVGALAWCFAVAEFGEWLHLSREMGALVAGVSLSTFPYALDVTSKVTSLRDFFVTLFFVGLGMSIPAPTGPVIVLALIIVAFTIASRIGTVFPPLYSMGQGLRASIIPALNLCQVSEFSLVLLSLGALSGHTSPETSGAVSFAFVILATLSTFVMARSDSVARGLTVGLKRAGLRDLDHGHDDPESHGHGARILILGFFRTASSLLVELERHEESILEQVAVVDFNPIVHRNLKARGIKVLYGDISARETLVHAGIGTAEILIASVPDSLLKGITNERLVRQLRALNGEAKVIATADLLADVPKLYAAGADYVMIGRVIEGNELCEVLKAVDAGLLEDKRALLDTQLANRREVLP